MQICTRLHVAEAVGINNGVREEEEEEEEEEEMEKEEEEEESRQFQ
jgi:hypothetical protein